MIASVLIKACDQMRYLSDTFPALSSQSVHDFEILLLYSGRSSETPRLAEEYGARVLPIAPEDFSHPKSLNLGAREALGRYLVCLSADAVPAGQHWLEELLAPLINCGTVAGSYGRHALRRGANAIDVLRIASRYRWAPACRVHGDGHAFSNANSAIRKELWQEHPFDDQLPGCEDYEWALWAQRREYAIAYAPKAAVRHTHGEQYGYQRYWKRIREFRRLCRVIDARPPAQDSHPSGQTAPPRCVVREQSTPCPWLEPSK
jgi:rhamnosyltransferase